MARAAEVPSAVLPTLVPTRTAVLTSGGQIRCGCGRRPRALRRGRWGHLPVLPGGSTLAAFAAVLGRALLGPFTEGRRGPLSCFRRVFLPSGLFPACFLIRLYFVWAVGGGKLNWVFLFSLNLRKWPFSNVVYSAKKVLTSMLASFGRIQCLVAPYPRVRTLYGCAPCWPGQVGEELSI